MTTNTQERKWRLGEVLKSIPQEEIEREKVIALVMVQWGFSRRTTMEYVKTLINADLVQENVNGSIIWRK